MSSALAWPARVVVLSGSSGEVLRGRPAEFRQRGLALSEAHGALDALASLGREPASAVVVPADRSEHDTEALVEAVHALTGTPVIIGIRALTGREEWGPAAIRSDVRVVDLPLTPQRLANVLGTFGRRRLRSDEVIQCGALELNVVEHRVQWHGARVHLPPRPFDVLQLLMAESPRVVSIREIVGRVQPTSQPGWNALGVRSAVKAIRHELRTAVPGAPSPVASVYGVGYCVSADSEHPRQVIAAASRSTRP